MSRSGVTEAPRQELTQRQAVVVDRLADAAEDEIRSRGYERFTVRNVAARAGVAPATAYTYFASKDHLITEVFWRRLRALPDPHVDRRRSPASRVADALQPVMVLVANEAELAAACTTAMLASDPDVQRLRDRVGALISRRIRGAIPDETNPAVVRALELAVAGAMLRAGMGHLGYAELPALVAEVAELLLR